MFRGVGYVDPPYCKTQITIYIHYQDEHEQPIDENQVRDAHDRAYNQGSGSGLSANSLGSAAAMQVGMANLLPVPVSSISVFHLLQIFKQFTSGGKGSGSSQNDLMSMAMAEASKLFDKSGASSGGKQDALNGAAMTVMKLVVQSKFKSTVGGSDSGGVGSLMSMVSFHIYVFAISESIWKASKFM